MFGKWRSAPLIGLLALEELDAFTFLFIYFVCFLFTYLLLCSVRRGVQSTSIVI